MFSKERDFFFIQKMFMFKRKRKTQTISDIIIRLYLWLSRLSRPAYQILWFIQTHFCNLLYIVAIFAKLSNFVSQYEMNPRLS